jgi:hypothetical protein
MNNDAHSDRQKPMRLRPPKPVAMVAISPAKEMTVKSVQRLWLQPASVSDVEGARSDDGNTTEKSKIRLPRNNNNNMVVVPRLGKPVISCRAMLRFPSGRLRRHRDIESTDFIGDDAKNGGDHSGSSDE